jgi:hypothetical protein
MTRDETVALFLQVREAWNAWAEKMLAEHKALEHAGRWATKKNSSGNLEPENAETAAWIKAAAAIFTFCDFCVSAGEPASGTAGEEKERNAAAGPAVKAVALETGSIDFDGFVFPGGAWFENGGRFHRRRLVQWRRFPGQRPVRQRRLFGERLV